MRLETESVYYLYIIRIRSLDAFRRMFKNVFIKIIINVCDGIKGCMNRNLIKYIQLSYLNDKSPYAYKCMSPTNK